MLQLTGHCERYGCNNLLNIHARTPFILGRNDFSEIYDPISSEILLLLILLLI
jgi:hypothetical protein